MFSCWGGSTVPASQFVRFRIWVSFAVAWLQAYQAKYRFWSVVKCPCQSGSFRKTETSCLNCCGLDFFTNSNQAVKLKRFVEEVLDVAWIWGLLGEMWVHLLAIHTLMWCPAGVVSSFVNLLMRTKAPDLQRDDDAGTQKHSKAKTRIPI